MKPYKKPSNPTQEPKYLSSELTWQDVLGKEAWIMFPEKENWRGRLIATLYFWVEEPESLEIQQFCSRYKLQRQTLWEWSKKYPDIKAALDFVKLEIASKRRLGVLYKKFDKEMVLRDLHRYDPEEHEINLYHKEMKTDEEKSSHTFNITYAKPAVKSSEDLKKENEGLE